MAIKHAVDLEVGDRVHYDLHLCEVLSVNRANATGDPVVGKLIVSFQKIEHGEKVGSPEEAELEPDFILYTPETE